MASFLIDNTDSFQMIFLLIVDKNSHISVKSEVLLALIFRKCMDYSTVMNVDKEIKSKMSHLTGVTEKERQEIVYTRFFHKR